MKLLGYNKKLKYLLRYSDKALHSLKTTKHFKTLQNTSTKQLIMSYTLVIKRAFGANKDRNGKCRQGTTKNHVETIMADFGTIERIDCIDKKDRRNGENFRMFFIHYKDVSLDDAVRDALDNGKDLEVDNDNYGHFWLVAKYKKPADKIDDKKPRGVRIRSNRAPPPPPLDIHIDNTPETDTDLIPPPPPISDDGHVSLQIE